MTTLPIIDEAWEVRKARLEALRDAAMVAYGWNIRDAADYALLVVDDAAKCAELLGAPAASETHQIAAILDELVEAVEAARDAAQGQPRWLNAIDAAYDHLLQIDAVTIDAHGALSYHSESGQTYTANGTCQCVAFLNDRPCKHRAAARLVRRALERRRTLAPVLTLSQRISAAQSAAMARAA